MKKYNKGFTLIELIVVFSIILVIIGTTIAQYNTFTGQGKLKSEGKKLVDVLELAKKKALNADLLTTCTNFTGYRVVVAENSYSLRFCCNSNCSTVTTVKDYFFSTTDITKTGSTSTFNFPPLMKNPNFTVSSIQLKSTAINKCVNISISPIGIIELDETLATCI